MANPSSSSSSSSSTSKANRNINNKSSNNIMPIISSLPHPPGHDGNGNNNPSAAKKPVRRVSFSEFTTKHYDDSPNNPHHHHRSKRRSRCSGGGGRRCCAASCCCMCCMWLSIFLICLVLIVAVAGAMFLGYFQPKLPVVRIERLKLPMLNVTTSSQQNYLSTDIELFIVVLNVNKKVEFSYSPLTVYVSSGVVNLGKAEIPGFTQMAVSNMTVLKVRTGVSHALVDNEEGEKLRTSYEDEMSMKVDVMLSGSVRFIFGGGGSSGEGEGYLRTTKIPIGVLCKNVDVSRVGNNNHEPQCKVDLFYFQQPVTTNHNNNTNQPNVF